MAFTTSPASRWALVLGLGLFAYSVPAPLFGLPLDFDADGKSDRVVVQIADNGDLEWEAEGDQTSTPVGTAGEVGDHLIAGQWLSAGSSVVGYVRPSGSKLSWSILDGSSIRSATFGPKSALVVSGGDFNGDGITDAAVVRSTSAGLRWKINQSLFEGGTTQTFRHGDSEDVAFYMNLRGLRDGIAVLSQPASGPFLVRVRDLVTNRVRSIKRISRSLRLYGRPAPLARADGKDVLVFTRKGSASTTVVVTDQKGRRLRRAEVQEAVDTVIGDYLSDPGEEFAFATTDGFFVTNPFSGTTATLSAPAGIAVDDININKFQSDDDSGLPPARDTCYDQDSTDGAGRGFIWKPESDTQFGAVVILPGIYLNKVDEVRTTTIAGDTIRTLSFKGNANPDPGNLLRPHYIDRTMEGGSYRSQYRSISVEVDLINGACLRYPIDNPAQRVD